MRANAKRTDASHGMSPPGGSGIHCATSCSRQTAGCRSDCTSGRAIAPGPYRTTDQYVGGMTIVDVADDEAAAMWAGRVAIACGWPQEVRRFKQ